MELDRYVLILLFVVLNIFDVLTTLKILKQGGREENSVVRFILGRYGSKGFIAFKILYVISISVLLLKYFSILLWPVVILYLVIVLRNVRELRQGNLNSTAKRGGT